MKSNKRKILSTKNTKNYYTLKSLKKKNKPNKSLVKQKYMKGGATNLLKEGHAGPNSKVQRCGEGGKNIWAWLKIIHGCYFPFNIDKDVEAKWTYTSVGKGFGISFSTSKSSTHCIETFTKWEEKLNNQLNNYIEDNNFDKVSEWIKLARTHILTKIAGRYGGGIGVKIPSKSILFLPSGYVAFNGNGNKNGVHIININRLKTKVEGAVKQDGETYDFNNNLIEWADNYSLKADNPTENLNLKVPKLALIVPEGNDTLDYSEIKKFMKDLFDPIEEEFNNIYRETSLINDNFTNNIKILQKLTSK